MKTLQTLIKMHQRDLDEKRQELVELEEQKSELLHYTKKMDDELADEYELAASDPLISVTFGNYRKMIKERQATIAEILVELDNKIDNLTDIIADIYGEMKKHEIILQQKIDEKNKQEKIREDKILDDVAAGNYRMQQEGGQG